MFGSAKAESSPTMKAEIFYGHFQVSVLELSGREFPDPISEEFLSLCLICTERTRDRPSAVSSSLLREGDTGEKTLMEAGS